MVSLNHVCCMVQEAIKKMDHTDLMGRELKVQECRAESQKPPHGDNVGGGSRRDDRDKKAPSKNLFVANIPPACEDKHLYMHFENFGKGRYCTPIFNCGKSLILLKQFFTMAGIFVLLVHLNRHCGALLIPRTPLCQ